MFEDINKVLLITDMDGTFLPSSKIPGEKSLAAVSDFQRLGGKFSIATGRAIQAAAQYFNSFSVSCPIIMCNGGMVYDLNNRRQIYDVFVPKSTRSIVKQILADNPDVGCEILTLQNVYVPQMTPMEAQHNVICAVDPIVSDVDEIPDDWYKVLFAIEPEKMERLISYVQTNNWKEVDFVRSSKEYYEILPLGISKGSALKMMRKLCGMEDYTIVAMGDYTNDLEMIKAADFGICPSNAAEDVKAASDLVLDVSCEENAAAAAINFIYDKLA